MTFDRNLDGETAPERAQRPVYLVANGDLRLSANVRCWPAQQRLEADVTRAMTSLGRRVLRAHEVDESKGHGFIDSQRRGLTVFRDVPPDAPLLVVEAVWQYSHHLMAGLRSHRGPIMLLANWDGKYPGLVGLLNLAASLTKAGVRYSTLWSVDFTDRWALDGLRTWLDTGELVHPVEHVRPLPVLDVDARDVVLGRELAAELLRDKAIIGIFDEGCMGMYNAIIDDELLNAISDDHHARAVAGWSVLEALAGFRHDAHRAAVQLRHPGTPGSAVPFLASRGWGLLLADEQQVRPGMHRRPDRATVAEHSRYAVAGGRCPWWDHRDMPQPARRWPRPGSAHGVQVPEARHDRGRADVDNPTARLTGAYEPDHRVISASGERQACCVNLRRAAGGRS